MTEIITKAELARRLGISKARISQLAKRGLPVRDDGKLDLTVALNWIGTYCRNPVKRQAATSSGTSLAITAMEDDTRARLAAECVGCVAVKSARPVNEQDGNAGFFQLRLADGAVIGGFGFELEAVDILDECRALAEYFPEEIARPDLIHALT